MRWQDFSVPVTPVASAIQAADMDIDTDVSWAGVRQQFEDNEWPAVDYDVSKQEVLKPYSIALYA
jgi:hypothetical protein